MTTYKMMICDVVISEWYCLDINPDNNPTWTTVGSCWIYHDLEKLEEHRNNIMNNQANYLTPFWDTT